MFTGFRRAKSAARPYKRAPVLWFFEPPCGRPPQAWSQLPRRLGPSALKICIDLSYQRRKAEFFDESAIQIQPRTSPHGDRKYFAGRACHEDFFRRHSAIRRVSRDTGVLLIQIEIHLELPKFFDGRTLVAGSAQNAKIFFGISAALGLGMSVIDFKSAL